MLIFTKIITMGKILALLTIVLLVSCSTEYKIKRVQRMTVRDGKKYLKNIKKGKIEMIYPDSTLYPVYSN
jgi:hypothetical protein